MRVRLITLLVAPLVFVIGCSGSGGSSDTSAFVDGCLESTNLPRPVCECVAGKAKDELSARGFAFLVAGFSGDEAEVARLRNELSMEEAMAAGMFMTNAPARCAEEGEN